MGAISTDQPLAQHKMTHFRGLAARCNYLAADRPGCAFAAKEICRRMSSPTELGLQVLKRLARYLVGKPRLVWQYRWQNTEYFDVYSDTDWAGCPTSRRSTSGGCVMLGSHLIKCWSSTQPGVALSSGEAEVVGVTRAAAIALGFRSLLADFGIRFSARVWTDSFAAIGICKRQGLGKVRHLDTQMLWVQQRIRNNDLDIYYVPGEKNLADIYTKPNIPQQRMESLLECMGCAFASGRPESAPSLRTEGGTKTFLVKGASSVTGGQTGSGEPVVPGKVRWADAGEIVDINLVDTKARGPPHQRCSLDIATVQCDVVDIEIPEEYLPSDTDIVPHCTAAVGWSVSKVMPPEIKEDEEAPDAPVELGLKLGQAEKGRSKLTALCEHCI